MARQRYIWWRFLGWWPLALFVLGSGCGGKQEQTKPSDWDQINKVIRQVENWTVERETHDFMKLATEDFDAEAFVDTIWAGIDAEEITFDPRHLRVSDTVARAVIVTSYVQAGSVIARGKFVFNLVRVERGWRLKSFEIVTLPWLFPSGP